MSLDFEEFERKLDTLRDVVVQLICVDTKFDMTLPIFYEVMASQKIIGGGAKSFRDFFLNFTQALLDMGDGGQLKNHPSFRMLCGKKQHSHTDAIKDADYAEYLTAASLALYFLGQPFSQPWERVRQKVKSSIGGVPNGACVAKAIGDVVRSARIAGIRARSNTETKLAPASLQATARAMGPVAGQSRDLTAEPLLLHSHMPMVLHKKYVTAADAVGCVPESAHVLGHCYELLQIMLYAKEGLPFKYFVPISIFRTMLESEQLPLESAWDEALYWMRNRVFPESFTQQFIVLTRTETFRPVFLNESAGVLTAPRPVEGTEGYIPAPLPGTFIWKARLELMRESLTKIPVERMINLHKVAAGFHTRAQAFKVLFFPEP